jgi:hypothetical protein
MHYEYTPTSDLVKKPAFIPLRSYCFYTGTVESTGHLYFVVSVDNTRTRTTTCTSVIEYRKTRRGLASKPSQQVILAAATWEKRRSRPLCCTILPVDKFVQTQRKLNTIITLNRLQFILVMGKKEGHVQYQVNY